MNEKRTEMYGLRIAVYQSVAWNECKVQRGCWKEDDWKEKKVVAMTLRRRELVTSEVAILAFCWFRKSQGPLRGQSDRQSVRECTSGIGDCRFVLD